MSDENSAGGDPLEFDHKPTPAEVAEIISSEDPSDVESLSDKISHAKPRLEVWEEEGLVSLPARDSDNFPRAKDVVSNVIASNLAAIVDAPVVWVTPLKIEDMPVSIFMPIMGEDEVDISNPSQFVNASDLPLTMAFEEWILNTDDQERHFCAIQSEDGREFRVIDHGHSLLHILDRQNDGEVQGLDNIYQSVGHDPYPYSSVDEVRDAIARIQEVSDVEINNMIEKSFTELEMVVQDDEDFLQLLDQQDFHKFQLNELLQERRDHIEDILEDKFS